MFDTAVETARGKAHKVLPDPPAPRQDNGPDPERAQSAAAGLPEARRQEPGEPEGAPNAAAGLEEFQAAVVAAEAAVRDPDLAALDGLQAAVAAADAAVAALITAVRATADHDLDRVGLAGLGEALVATERLCRRADAARLLLIGEHDRRQGWKADGARSAKEWVSTRCGLTRGEAAGQVQTASVLPFLPATTVRLAAGRVTTGQARAAAATARRVPFEHRGDLDVVVAGAVDGGGDTTAVRAAIDGWAHRLDQRLLTVRADHAHQQRRLTLTRSPAGGAAGEFRLDPVGAETVLTALDALSAPAGEADRRTAEQRRADALVGLARRALDRGDTPVMGGERPHVTVVVPVATLVAGPQANGTAPATLGYGGPVSGETARLLGCDAQVSRVVMAGASVVLDAGRSSRLVSATQRRALAARDGGCRGCNAPPAWCQAHHVVHWAHGGATDLANLVLLCFACHDAVHHRNWQLTRNRHGLWNLHPPRPRPHSHPHPDSSSPDSSPSRYRAGPTPSTRSGSGNDQTPSAHRNARNTIPTTSSPTAAATATRSRTSACASTTCITATVRAIPPEATHAGTGAARPPRRTSTACADTITRVRRTWGGDHGCRTRPSQNRPAIRAWASSPGRSPPHVRAGPLRRFNDRAPVT